MSPKIYNIYKPLGKTPLETLEIFRKKKKLSASLKITYAGRLDPMAEGVLLLLTGKKVHEKEKYLKLDKTYRAQILFGISTDTFDVLGKILKTDIRNLGIKDIKHELKNFIGKIILPIPPFSSVPISGKPSFIHARAGNLNLDNSQSREMEIYKIKFNSYKKIKIDTVLKTIQNKIKKVSGDFRQEEVLKLWGKKLKPGFLLLRQPLTPRLQRSGGYEGQVGKNHNDTLTVLDITISCASGTYIRSIAFTLGKNLSCPAILYNLKREKVGEYTIKKAARF